MPFRSKEDVSESNLLTHSWTAATTETWAYSSAPGAENRKLLCSFYTAERLFLSLIHILMNIEEFGKVTLERVWTPYVVAPQFAYLQPKAEEIKQRDIQAEDGIRDNER